jgi:hypothetical protein
MGGIVTGMIMRQRGKTGTSLSMNLSSRAVWTSNKIFDSYASENVTFASELCYGVLHENEHESKIPSDMVDKFLKQNLSSTHMPPILPAEIRMITPQTIKSRLFMRECSPEGVEGLRQGLMTGRYCTDFYGSQNALKYYFCDV